jgi:glycerol-3-phosphate O-acyltransferase
MSTLFSAIAQKWRKNADAFLKGTHYHFLSFVPSKKGAVSSWFLRLFYRGIKDNDDQLKVIRSIPADARIVYLNKFKSYFEFLFYHTRYAQHKLSPPEIGFEYRIVSLQPSMRLLRVFFSKLDYLLRNWKFPDPYRDEYYRHEILSGTAAFLSLVKKKGFYDRFIKAKADPIRHLVEIQKTSESEIFLVPQLMFFGKKPTRSIPTLKDIFFGSEARPGKIRRLMILFRSPEKIFYEISHPINLKKFLQNPDVSGRSIEVQALILRRNILFQLNRHRQSITGPVKKSSEEFKEIILTNERLKSYMDEHAQKRGVPLWKVRKKADAYLEEIAAKQHPGLLKFAETCVGWVLNTMFQGVSINQEGLNRIKAISQQGPIIFIPCHKSHVDYLMLPYLMYRNNMPVPHIAAGKNLSFWPVGPVFRALGAFFLRRSFRGNVLYSKVFAEYIHRLLEEGYNIKLFIEGTRSRSGKLIMPKLGFLSILLNAYKNGACEDLIFAPIFIGYDRILEEKSYIREIEGGKKEDENFLQVLSARKFLKNRYGKIYIKFNEPISLKALLHQYEADLNEMSVKDMNALCRNLGHRIINAINTLTVVTPHALVAAILLNTPKERISYEQILSRVETYLNHLNQQKADIADTLMIDHVHAVGNVLESYISRKFIENIFEGKDSPLEEALFKVNVSKRPLLEYYKNNCVAFFIPAAFVALIILEKDAFQFCAGDLRNGYAFLQDFFKYEFAYDSDRSPDFFVRKTVKAFIDDAVIIPHPALPETYNITSVGFRKLKLYARFLKTYFESYWVALSYFESHPQNATDPKDRLKKIQNRGEKMFKRNEIDLIESLSKINYDNAINFFTTHQVKGKEDAEAIAFYKDTIQRYLNRINS